MTKKRIALKIVRRVGICILTTVVLLLIGLLGVVRIMEFGPSKTARNLFVNSAMESSAGGILVTLFFSDEEIARIRAINSIQKTNEVTDSSLISDTKILTQEEKSMIEVIDIEKDTYRGKMMIVRDPSRVMVGTSGEYGKSCKGKKVSEIAESYGAIAATNAGGFRDAGGVGTGGEPDGLVISEGRLKWGSLGTTYGIIGIDNNNVLVVGDMTAQAALDRGVRDAVSFGPVLVVNGVKTLKLDIPLVPETRIKWAFVPLHIAIIYILKLCLDEEIIPRCRFPCSRGYHKKHINWQKKQ